MKKNQLLDVKSKLQLSLLVFIFLIIFFDFGLDKFLLKLKPRLPQQLVIGQQDEYKAYFEIEASKTSLSQNEKVDIFVNLATTGEEFDAAVAVLEWDANDFEFVSAEPADLSGDEQPLNFFTGSSQAKRLMTLYVIHTDPPLEYMTTSKGQLTRFFTLRLNSLVNNPTSSIKISQAVGSTVVHFVNSGIQNSVDQSLANQDNLVISFGTDENAITLNLKLKLNGVPANNNNINLEEIYEEQDIRVILKDNEANLYYHGDEGLEAFSYDKESMAYTASVGFSQAELPNASYVLLIKGPAHRQIQFCQTNQESDHVCRRDELIVLEAGSQYSLDFTGYPLEFGDVDWSSSVGVDDYSFVKACKETDSRIGSEDYDKEAGCHLADGNMDGVVDSTDIALLFKTLSDKPDDE